MGSNMVQSKVAWAMGGAVVAVWLACSTSYMATSVSLKVKFNDDIFFEQSDFNEIHKSKTFYHNWTAGINTRAVRVLTDR